MSLKHALLVLLERAPASGYDIRKRFSEHLGYFWNASHQQIYQQLKIMHRNGEVECELESQRDRPDKKNYSITVAGRESLQKWLETKAKPYKVNDALLVKLYAGHLVDPMLLSSEMASHRQEHETVLSSFKTLEKKYQSLSDAEKSKYRLPYLTLRRGILEIEAWLMWCGEVDEELGNLSKH